MSILTYCWLLLWCILWGCSFVKLYEVILGLKMSGFWKSQAFPFMALLGLDILSNHNSQTVASQKIITKIITRPSNWQGSQVPDLNSSIMATTGSLDCATKHWKTKHWITICQKTKRQITKRLKNKMSNVTKGRKTKQWITKRRKLQKVE
jgi:hypothetical protein